MIFWVDRYGRGKRRRSNASSLGEDGNAASGCEAPAGTAQGGERDKKGAKKKAKGVKSGDQLQDPEAGAAASQATTPALPEPVGGNAEALDVSS